MLASNRTTLELKRVAVILSLHAYNSSNRTTLELKLVLQPTTSVSFVF